MIKIEKPSSLLVINKEYCRFAAQFLMAPTKKEQKSSNHGNR
jgi:hypothetical protein